MAHEIRSSDRFAEVRSGGQRAWHGLGVEIAAGLSAQVAFEQIGLGWRTELCEVQAQRLTANGFVHIPLREHRAHIRSDTGQVLGLVSDGYKPIDNMDLAAFGDAILGEDAAASCETAGSLYDGRKVFALLRLPSNIVASKGDELATYIAVTNGHGGCAAFAAYPTTVRIVCANTLRMSEQDLSRGARFVHTGDLQGKLKTARLCLGFAQKELAALEKQVQAMVWANPTNEAREAFFGHAFGLAFPQAGLIDEALAKWFEKRAETLARFRELYMIECDKLKQSSLWLAFNAVTEWHDHERGRFDAVKTSDARVHSNLFGVSHQAKAKTLKLALSMV